MIVLEASTDRAVVDPSTSESGAATEESQSWSRWVLRSFDIAARSLRDGRNGSGVLQNASLAAEGVLFHHWAGLGQYATIRVGSEASVHVMERLRAWSEAHLPEILACESSMPPSALLYRQVRLTMAEVPQRPLTADARAWFVPTSERVASAVLRLRRSLTAEQAEAVELCHHRGLEPNEAAFVLGQPREVVEQSLAAGLATADLLLAARDKRHGITRERLLLLAFALGAGRLKEPSRPPRDPVLPVGAVIGQRYEVEALLGAGTFADVYRARDRDVTGHVVALKILRRPAADPQAVKNALRELQLIASVVHPSVVQLKDHGWLESHLWFVMPLYSGETLARRLERGPLSRREAREIFEVLAEALAAMHRVGVRHQDVKPENVFLANIGRQEHGSSRVLPVLLDLGVATKDVELVLAGTPAYFAPEVAARYCGIPDPPTVGPKADVFSLALTLRDALDVAPSDPVVLGGVDAFVFFRARHAPLPPDSSDLRDLGPWFERWLHRLPDARPDAEEFRRELAVLTKPEETRQRRASLLRLFVPILLATLTLFASVVYVLTREASLRGLEAEEERIRATRAFRRAESMHADLELHEAHRRQLEAEVTKLETEYQNSRLTREELATRLASAEGEAQMLEQQHTSQTLLLRRQKDDLTSLRERHEVALAGVESLRERRDELARELDRTKISLEQERGLRVEAQAAAHTLALRLDATQRVIDDTRARMTELHRLVQASPATTVDAAPGPALERMP